MPLYFFIQYIPNIARQEKINVGVIAIEDGKGYTMKGNLNPAIKYLATPEQICDLHEALSTVNQKISELATLGGSGIREWFYSLLLDKGNLKLHHIIKMRDFDTLSIITRLSKLYDEFVAVPNK